MYYTFVLCCCQYTFSFGTSFEVLSLPQRGVIPGDIIGTVILWKGLYMIAYLIHRGTVVSRASRFVFAYLGTRPGYMNLDHSNRYSTRTCPSGLEEYGP